MLRKSLQGFSVYETGDPNKFILNFCFYGDGWLHGQHRKQINKETLQQFLPYTDHVPPIKPEKTFLPFIGAATHDDMQYGRYVVRNNEHEAWESLSHLIYELNLYSE